jgi:hypothetical protein
MKEREAELVAAAAECRAEAALFKQRMWVEGRTAATPLDFTARREMQMAVRIKVTAVDCNCCNCFRTM